MKEPIPLPYMIGIIVAAIAVAAGVLFFMVSQNQPIALKPKPVSSAPAAREGLFKQATETSRTHAGGNAASGTQ
jgi:hypothetical protein